MPILLTYIATDPTMGRLARTLNLQKRFFKAIIGMDRVVITDYASSLDKIRPALDGIRVIRGVFERNGMFCLAAARNFAIQHAEDNGYSHLFDGDSDRILLSISDRSLPEKDIGCVFLHHATITQDDNALVDLANGCGLHFTPTSFFVIPRPLMKFRFCEELGGIFWQDIDYLHNVIVPAGHGQVDCLARGIHLYHSSVQTPEQTVQIKKNGDLCLARWRKRNGNKKPPW